MEVKVGSHEFRDQEAMNRTLGTRIARIYDFTAQAREVHDEDAILNGAGKQIKCTRKELISYWKQRLSLVSESSRSIQPGEEVPNLWR
jgi:hypothetical protein